MQNPYEEIVASVSYDINFERLLGKFFPPLADRTASIWDESTVELLHNLVDGKVNLYKSLY